MIRRFVPATLAYLVPTFALGFVWHLILFKDRYAALGVYRPDVVIPFGFLAILTQAIIFAWLFEHCFTGQDAGGRFSRGLRYAVMGGTLSWTFTTLAVAAKNVMTSVPDYIVIETAFTVVQWAMVGPLTALAHGRQRQPEPAAA